MEQSFGSKYVGFPLEQVGDFGIQSFLAIMNERIDLGLVGQRAVPGFVELDERLSRLGRLLVDDDQPVTNFEQPQHLA